MSHEAAALAAEMLNSLREGRELLVLFSVTGFSFGMKHPSLGAGDITCAGDVTAWGGGGRAWAEAGGPGAGEFCGKGRTAGTPWPHSSCPCAVRAPRPASPGIFRRGT